MKGIITLGEVNEVLFLENEISRKYIKLMELIFGLIINKQISRYILSASYSWSVTINIEYHPMRHSPTLKGINRPVVGGGRVWQAIDTCTMRSIQWQVSSQILDGYRKLCGGKRT